MNDELLNPIHNFLEPINITLSEYGHKIFFCIGVIVILYLSIYIVTKLTKSISSKKESGFSGNVYNLDWYTEKLFLRDIKDED